MGVQDQCALPLQSKVFFDVPSAVKYLIEDWVGFVFLYVAHFMVLYSFKEYESVHEFKVLIVYS